MRKMHDDPECQHQMDRGLEASSARSSAGSGARRNQMTPSRRSRRVGGVVGRLARFPVLALEALERRPGLNQRTIHGEVFVRKQLQTAGMRPRGSQARSRGQADESALRAPICEIEQE
jgi:hypothetical protein